MMGNLIVEGQHSINKAVSIRVYKGRAIGYTVEPYLGRHWRGSPSPKRRDLLGTTEYQLPLRGREAQAESGC